MSYGMGKKGGKRAGAGRPPGSKTAVVMPDLRALIAPHVPELIARLMEIARSPDLKVANPAISMLMERGYGKAVQPVSGPDGQSDLTIRIVKISEKE